MWPGLAATAPPAQQLAAEEMGVSSLLLVVTPAQQLDRRAVQALVIGSLVLGNDVVQSHSWMLLNAWRGVPATAARADSPSRGDIGPTGGGPQTSRTRGAPIGSQVMQPRAVGSVSSARSTDARSSWKCDQPS
jgi:hypothetical protein